MKQHDNRLLSMSIDSKRYKDTCNSIIEDYELTLYRQQKVALLGPSGCGKTTLLRIIAGIDKDFSGKLNYNTKDRAPLNDVTGYVHQTPVLFPWMTVIQHLRFLAPYLSETEGRNILEIVDLLSDRNKYSYQLSEGMKKRLSIALCLLRRPSILLLDEPLTGIDYRQKRKLCGVLTDIIDKYEMGSILVTHDIDVAIMFADEIHILAPNPLRCTQVIYPRDHDHSEINNIIVDMLD